jgi:hypothetical protein
MSGEGENNKHSSAERKSSNQSKQGVKGNTKKSDAEKRGGKTSAPRNKKKDEKLKLNTDKDQE